MQQDTHPNQGPGDEVIEVRTIGELGSAIRTIRRQRGWTQTDLASWTGTNRFTIHRLESGKPVGLPLAMAAITFLGWSIRLSPRAIAPGRDTTPARG